jgi:uncharacterized protein
VLIALDRPLIVHVSEPVGHRYPGKGDVSPIAAWRLAARHPRLRIVFAHWGGGLPYFELMPEVRAALANTYYDSAATTYLYDFRIFQVTAELIGAERVLFATDYPLLRQGPFLDRVRALNLDESDLRRILGENAARLLGVEEWPTVKAI